MLIDTPRQELFSRTLPARPTPPDGASRTSTPPVVAPDDQVPDPSAEHPALAGALDQLAASVRLRRRRVEILAWSQADGEAVAAARGMRAYQAVARAEDRPVARCRAERQRQADSFAILFRLARQDIGASEARWSSAHDAAELLARPASGAADPVSPGAAAPAADAGGRQESPAAPGGCTGGSAGPWLSAERGGRLAADRGARRAPLRARWHVLGHQLAPLRAQVLPGSNAPRSPVPAVEGTSGPLEGAATPTATAIAAPENGGGAASRKRRRPDGDDGA